MSLASCLAGLRGCAESQAIVVKTDLSSDFSLSLSVLIFKMGAIIETLYGALGILASNIERCAFSSS